MNRDQALAKEMKLAEEFFGTAQDPDQMPINDESVKKLDTLCDGWLESEFDENGEPISWAVLMPTQKELAEKFLDKKINEKELLDFTVPQTQYDALYFVSAITVPEQRGKGWATKVIERAVKKMPITDNALFFAWPTTKEGVAMIKSLEKFYGKCILARQ
jgi:hypothetical protein